ncbi:Dihydrofolate reductase [Streptococcus sp. DD10]|uniref:dihydrofolate reductase n=1 Tax=Streptococcus sp. DD10 TaxID=1777878 RepID=UPI000796E5E7|nr:dihydrofolate reductase [Streptococcus sp. DD10]KXT75109.1 Dihydrofolate reductase [Streptococcus sp. DD10]
MSKKIQAIWAQSQGGVIGKDNIMPWYLPAELKHFKETTLGQAILMGRVTYEGMGKRTLPNRVNIVLTQDRNYQVADDAVLVFHCVEDVLKWYDLNKFDLFIIGGAQILSLFEPYLEELIKTEIDADLDGDTYFPENFDWEPYELVSSIYHAKDEKNQYDFTVNRFHRKDGD